MFKSLTISTPHWSIIIILTLKLPILGISSSSTLTSMWWILCGLQANHTFIFCLYLLKYTFIHCHSCVMFAMKSMNIYNDQVNYDEIIIQWSLVFKLLNIPIRGIFEKYIKLSKKNSTIWSDSYDEYGWFYGHWCRDTKDKQWVLFRERVHWIDPYESMIGIMPNC